MITFWKSGTKNALKVIHQNNIHDNIGLQFLHITKGKELKYWINIQ